MGEYIPMQGPLPGVQYVPSNGTEGECFIESWCTGCARDKVMNGEASMQEGLQDDGLLCPILSASYRGEAVEWRDLGEREVCLAFVEVDSPILERDDKTIDMFDPQEGK